MRFRWLYFAISGVFLLISAFSLIRWGLRPGIDFAGGSLWEISFKDKVSAPQLKDYLKAESEVLSVYQDEKGSFLIKMTNISPKQKEALEAKLKDKFSEFKEIRFESLGPSVGRELLTKTLLGVALAALGILLYVAIRFKSKSFGICAILAMLHDTFILIGFFSLLGRFYGVEVDALFVTALLTILSFSVHDTVVVYDRIRELGRLYPRLPFVKLADFAVAQTLVRSLNNSMTIIFVLVALFLLGGESIRWFSLALLIGTISGTYSSTFTAVPLLVVWQDLADRKASGKSSNSS
jgi:preprotein translocase subunit SecF